MELHVAVICVTVVRSAVIIYNAKGSGMAAKEINPAGQTIFLNIGI
jgi:hypothetical protein